MTGPFGYTKALTPIQNNSVGPVGSAGTFVVTAPQPSFSYCLVWICSLFHTCLTQEPSPIKFLHANPHLVLGKPDLQQSPDMGHAMRACMSLWLCIFIALWYGSSSGIILKTSGNLDQALPVKNRDNNTYLLELLPRFASKVFTAWSKWSTHSIIPLIVIIINYLQISQK